MERQPRCVPSRRAEGLARAVRRPAAPRCGRLRGSTSASTSGSARHRGESITVADAADHIFGVVLVNDWSARDIQAWETVPLGPFLGKSFQTSISPWVVPLAALDAARVTPPSTGVELSDYLREPEPWGLDIDLELRVNGATARTGDLFASGTVSGSRQDQYGSLIEVWGNERFLADGDEVVITATAPAADGGRIDLGEVRGRVLPATMGYYFQART